MLTIKSIGAALLLIAAWQYARQYRERCERQLALVRAWRAYLGRMKHAVRRNGAQFSELVRCAMQPSQRSALLPRISPPPWHRDMAQSEKMSWLCHAAAERLPSDDRAAELLRDFTLHAAQAVSAEQLCETISVLDGHLERLELSTEQLIRQRCRAAPILSLCGAMCLVLLFW